MKRILLFASLFFFLKAFLQAQPLSLEYVHSVQGLKRAELKTSLHDLIQPRQVLDYGGKGEGYTWAGFFAADAMPDGITVRDRYSYEQRSFSGLQAVAGMNIEHVWANSWWGHTVNSAYRDLFNLFPADGPANQRKSNNPIGIVNGPISFDNGSMKVGKSSIYSSDSLITVWEPADEWKGDFARTYFYMATTYQHMTEEWQTTEGLLTVDPTSWATMRPWVYELMLAWAEEDPVDDIERVRNEVIYGIQGNRNPFVDVPILADYIWGSSGDLVFYVDPASTEPEVFVPVHDVPLDFGLQALSLGMTRRVQVRGRNLPAGLKVAVEGEGFAMSETELTAEELVKGKDLMLTSNATSGGVYDALLVLRGEDSFEQSTPLHMTVIDGVPAYPAQNIVCSVNSRSFTASWMNMHLADGEHYTLEVYSKNADGSRKTFTGYPVELADTFCVVTAITPVFSTSSSELFFACVPGLPSQPQTVKITVLGISGYAVGVSCPEPFEVSIDGETWVHDLQLTASQTEMQVRFGGAADDGTYEDELTLSLPDVKDIVLSLTASVDITKSFFESFELGSKGGYAEGIVTCNASSWLMTNALLATGDANCNDSRCVRMKIGGSITMQDDKLGGCDSLWFYAGLYNKDTGVKLTVSYSLDGGSTWMPVVSELTFTAGEWRRYGYKIDRDGFLRLKFETQAGNQNKRINIDDIQMSDYGTSDALRELEWAFSENPVVVYTLDGRYVGTTLPARAGIYLVRQGDRVLKVKR